MTPVFFAKPRNYMMFHWSPSIGKLHMTPDYGIKRGLPLDHTRVGLDYAGRA